MKQKSHIFNSIKVERPPRNTFDLSHSVRTSFNMGELVPIAAIDFVPGDSFKIGTESLLRFAPLISPIFEKVAVKVWWFAVPDRILFDDIRDYENFWKDWTNGTAFPYVNQVGGTNTGKLLDYIYGVDVLPAGININVAPIACYTKIRDDWFRPEHIDDTEVHIPLSIGNNTGYRTILQSSPYKVPWRKDYFTSALPWPQLGANAVQLPLLEADTATVLATTTDPGTSQWRRADTGAVYTSGGSTAMGLDAAGTTQTDLGGTPTDVYYDPEGTLYININNAAATINELRSAFRLQELLEISAMAGTRYNEIVWANFGVKIPDARAQRPEYLGSWSGYMNISEVLQTSAAHEDTVSGRGTPLGTMGGHGVSVVNGDPISYYAYEHGWLMGLIAVAPEPSYQQGLARKFSRSLNTDYYVPKLAQIGEQEILNQEIYLAHTNPGGTWGYAARYSEYKFEQNRVSGEMRNTLSHWTLTRIFSSDPPLNEDFVYCDPSARIFNTLYEGGGEPEYSGDQIFGLIYNHVYASRLMPLYGRPTI